MSLALALFGGICSGKTTFANLIEKNHGFVVVSKDRCIYESDMRYRDGEIVSWEQLRIDFIQSSKTHDVVIDETIRIDTLDPFKETWSPLIGVKLDSDTNLRRSRLAERVARQTSILDELSSIVGFNLRDYLREKRRDFWRDREFCNSIRPEDRRRFNALLREIYHSGSHFMKDEDPNPACFDGLDYVVGECSCKDR